MLDLTRRLVWFFVVASALSYAVFLVAGSTIHNQAAKDIRGVLVRDHLKPGEHHLSGMVMVHSNCAQLSVKTEQVADTVYHLKFTTWDEPHVTCAYEDTPRAFRAIVFAPAVGVSFIATLDETPLNISVVLAERIPTL